MQIISSSNRDWKIDSLRALTLLGISLVHFTEQFYAGSLPKAIADVIKPEIQDKMVSGFIGFFIWGKFYLIFSFLFGLSFQFIVKEFRTSSIKKIIIRLLILFVIGWIHHLHYRGDILTIYALLGLMLPLFYHLPSKILLIIGLTLATNVPSVLIRFYEAVTEVSIFNSFFNLPDGVLMKYYQTVAKGSYLEIWNANAFEFINKMKFQLASGRIFITFGLFLLGMWVGKSGKILDQFFDKSLLKRSFLLLMICVLLLMVAGLTVQFLKWNNNPFMFIIFGLPMDIFNLALSTILVCLFYLLAAKEKFHSFFYNLSYTGRMGLTTYVMQTLIGTFIFFGWGLGLLFSFGTFVTFILGLTVFVFQVWFSKLWLTKFTYGPLEKLWRSLADTLIKV